MGKCKLSYRANVLFVLLTAACAKGVESSDCDEDAALCGGAGGQSNGGSAGTRSGGGSGGTGGIPATATGGNGNGGTGGSAAGMGGNTAGKGGNVAGMGGNAASRGGNVAGMGGQSTGGVGGNQTGGTGMGGMGGVASASWTMPTSLVADLGRLAIGNQLHLAGHTGGQLIHLRSSDNGATWSAPKVIAAASGNYPAMCGGLFAEGDNVYLLTADANMDSSAGAGGAQLDFRKSSDNGASWSAPIRITSPSAPIFRVRIAASGSFVHVAGTSAPTTDASEQYFRSVDGGATWKPGVALATNLGKYGGGQTVAVDGATVHIAYTKVLAGVGGGPTQYIRSMDNGASWSQPVVIGEDSAASNRQARVQLFAVDGRVFACWQRESSVSGGAVPADRIGYNRSADGGKTWATAKVLPEGSGVDRNHQHLWMAAGGGVHVIWRSGDNVADAAGYMHSPDYGATWKKSMIAVDTTATKGSNHPWAVVANTTAVHILTGPDGTMQYASRRLR